MEGYLIGIVAILVTSAAPSHLFTTYVPPPPVVGAGLPTFFIIHARDRFDNVVDAAGFSGAFQLDIVGSRTQGSATLEAGVRDFPGLPGVYYAQFTPTTEGDFLTLAVRVFGEIALQGTSEHLVRAVPANEADLFSILEVPSSDGTAGVTREFLLSKVMLTGFTPTELNAFDFDVFLQFSEDPGSVVTVALLSFVGEQRTRNIQILGSDLTRAGTYVASVVLDGFYVQGAPIVFQVNPAAVSFSNSRVEVLSDSAYTPDVGEPVRVMIALRDAFGNVISDPVAAELVIHSESTLNEIYRWTLAPDPAGGGVLATSAFTRTSDVVTVNVYLGGSLLESFAEIVFAVADRSPLRFVNARASLAGSPTVPRDGATFNRVAGSLVSLYVVVYDDFGNVYSTNTDSTVQLTYTHSPSGDAGAFPGIFDGSRDAIRMTYSLVTAGSYAFTLSLRPAQTAVATTAWTDIMLPGPIDPPSSLLSELTGAVAGTEGFLKVVLRDEFKNVVTDLGSNTFLTVVLIRTDGTLLRGSLPPQPRTDNGVTLAISGDEVTGSFSSMVAGVYNLRLYVNGEMVDPLTSVEGVEVAVVVRSALLDLAATTVSGPGLLNSRAGIPSEIYVSTEDVYGNPRDAQDVLEISLTALVGSRSSAQIVTFPPDFVAFDPASGTYTVSFTPPVSGVLDIGIALSPIGSNQAPASAPGGPFAVSISSGEADAVGTTMVGSGLVGAVLDTTATFTIIARDSLGNRVLEGGDPFRLEVVHTSNNLRAVSALIDNRDGTYSATYTLTGLTGIGTLHVSLAGVAVTAGCAEVGTFRGKVGCRIIVRASAGPFNLTSTKVIGDGAFVGTANGLPDGTLLENNYHLWASGSFDIQLFDSDGLPLPVAEEPFEVRLNDSKVDVVVVAGGAAALPRRHLMQTSANGTYTVYYMRSVAGIYKVTIFHDDVDVTDTVLPSHPDFTNGRWLTIYPATTFAQRSSYRLLTPLPVAVSVPFVLGVSAVDRFGNIQLYSPENPDPGRVFVVTLLSGGATVATATVKDSYTLSAGEVGAGIADVTQVANFVALRLTGDYAVMVSLDGVSVPPLEGTAPASGLVLAVAPGKVDAALAIVEGGGLQGSLAGVMATIEVTPRDSSGNVVNDGTLVCDTTMVLDNRNETIADYYNGAFPIQGSVDVFCSPAEECLDAFAELECIYFVSYNVTFAGAYNLTVRLCSEEAATNGNCGIVTGRPFSNVIIRPGPVPDNAKGYINFIHPPTQQVAAGKPHFLRLQAQDLYGNNATDGGLQLQVYFQLLPDGGAPGNPATAIVDSNDGSYQVEYILEEGGLGIRYLCTVYIGIDVAANLTIQTSTPQISAARSFVYGRGTETATAGVVQKMYIQLVDEQGRYQDDMAQGQQLVLTMEPPVPEFSPTVIRQNEGDRLMVMNYLAFVAIPSGYSLTIFLETDGLLEGVGPTSGAFTVTVLPNTIDPAMTYVDDLSDFSGQVGQIQQVRVVTRDTYGNFGIYDATAVRLDFSFAAYGSGPDGELFIQGPGAATTAYIELFGPDKPGVYVAKWSAKTVGTYGLRIYLNGQVRIDRLCVYII
jgi:hypothetical protein